ncbi:6-phosphogluconate dehydrogenase C-terminal domain-like protein [Thozetella sp. PMI_491]|nr:6-phosphogluconate dehydrogenase C-terminal domain-like protein [Thozetella sp. PMI_491]
MAPTIGILSIGEMGLGVAQLLKFHQYRVVTNVAGRSKATQDRARENGIEGVDDDLALVQQSDYILSIVPPRDAIKTAERIRTAAAASPEISQGTKTLHFLDLNAVSPTTSAEVVAVFANSPHVIPYDGVISGGVPHPTTFDDEGKATQWHCPTLLMSGPNKVEDPDLIRILNLDHMSEKVGAAVAVKMCFSMTTKGFIALAIQSFTTAHRLGVRDELETFLGKYKPATLKMAQDGLVTMPPKAYRWIHEMLEIAKTAEHAGFESKIFEGVAEMYRVVSEDSILGQELPDARVRGKTVEDVVTLISEGMDKKQGSA